MNKIILLALLLIPVNTTLAQSYRLSSLRQSAKEVGLRVANRFIQSPHGVYTAPNTKPHIPYFEVCAWHGALIFAGLTADQTLQKQLNQRFAVLMEKEKDLLPIPDHVDYNVFGIIPLEIYLKTKQKSSFELGINYADTQWAEPFGPRVVKESYQYHNQGYSWQTRLWIDDMYMITMIQAQAFRATKNTKYLDRTAREMVLYLDQLQKENGLFYHTKDVPMFWGRGNGWMAAGMTELLRVLPKRNPHRQRIMKAYQKMMATLLKYQADDGMWRQLVDDNAAWKETSSTGMFTYAMVTGVKNGWLNQKSYEPAAYKAWKSLITYINNDSEISDVCEGTGARNDRQYYLDRKRLIGDYHGQAPLLWSANALLRKKGE